MVRDVEALGEGGAVAVVAVEELDDGTGLADGGEALVGTLSLDRVDDSDAVADAQGVAGALHHLVGIRKPGEPEVVILEGGLGHRASAAPPGAAALRR